MESFSSDEFIQGYLEEAGEHLQAINQNLLDFEQNWELPQVGERRVTIERPGTTAYVKLAFHAPEATSPDFFPLLVLDSVLTGANGVRVYALPQDRLMAAMRKYGRIR